MIRTKICTKHSLVVGASASHWWRLDFLSPKCDNFAYWPYWPFAETIENVLKNWVDQMGYCKAIRDSYVNDDVFHSWMERFNLSNKTILLKKISISFFFIADSNSKCKMAYHISKRNSKLILFVSILWYKKYWIFKKMYYEFSSFIRKIFC